MAGKSLSSGADLRVPRRATSLHADHGRKTLSLAEWRDLSAYVLLGDPGAGKSESMRVEAKAVDGFFVSARDFIALGMDAADARKTLFIDGLDEMRAGGTDGRVPLDAIRSKLHALGRPCFRISCREHDWRAQTDLAALCRVAPKGAVEELHLEPLSKEEQRLILRDSEVPEPEAFLEHARQHGISNLLGNPLLLGLTIQAVAKKGGWPASRREIYELSCSNLATEQSVEHRDAKPLNPGDVERLIGDAGLLCAVLLLSGKASLTRAQDGPNSAIAWHTLPAALHMHDPQAALASKIFTTTAGESAPLHRSIAEYLAGQAIAKLLRDGLPLGRILALMQGDDGGIVEPLRGLLGWLTVHNPSDRLQLIRLDPLGVVLNGDIAEFTLADKMALLEALRGEAKRNERFRSQQWVSYPFAPLATIDMANALGQILDDHSTAPSHQALVDCVLDALNHGDPIPTLISRLEAWVEDATASFGNRIDALRAWKRCTGFDAGKAREWLDMLHQGILKDLDARLAGALLLDLYPTTVSPKEVLHYLPRPGDVSADTVVPQFWRGALIDQSRPQDFAVLADEWVQFLPQPRASRDQYDGEMSYLRTGILANAIEQSGDTVSDDRLHAWLGICVDKHGFSKLDRDDGGRRVAQWLTDRPMRIKAVVVRAWHAERTDSTAGQNYFWKCERRLHGCQLPSDWLQWMLAQATKATSDNVARYCFDFVASAVINPPPGFDVPSMAQIEAWVVAHGDRWPQAYEWLTIQWSCPLDENWQREGHLSQRKHEAEITANNEARRELLAPHLAAIAAGTASIWLMHQLATAYRWGFAEVTGTTPAVRVQNFLMCNERTAYAAIAGLSHVLKRDDLPTANEIFALAIAGKEHLVRRPMLLAATLTHDRIPDAVDAWSDSLLSILVASWLTDGTGEATGWYERAVKSRATVVAPMVQLYAMSHLGSNEPIKGVSLSSLLNEPGHAALAPHVLPPLLEGFPRRASGPARRELNCSLLAALYQLDNDVASNIVRGKLNDPLIDRMQRICWLVADLPYRTDAMQRVADAVGTNKRRAIALGIALHEQGSLGRALNPAPVAMLSSLFELLAPITRPEWPSGVCIWPEAGRRDTVHVLVNRLASDAQPAAGTELQRLVNLPHLAPWSTHLRQSISSQRGAAREAYYAFAEPEAVALALANGAPANQGDLMALTVAHLREIERHLRGSDTTFLRFFWDVQTDKSRTPKDENDCRDLLLDRLRTRLDPFDIHVVPERQAAHEKRADLLVDFTANGQKLAVPIEIKKENHRRLWSACLDQLNELYTIEPTADGHGIYLVLWFGSKLQSSPEGQKPASALDLQKCLTERIPEPDRARLKVLVMDLSWPRAGESALSEIPVRATRRPTTRGKSPSKPT